MLKELGIGLILISISFTSCQLDGVKHNNENGEASTSDTVATKSIQIGDSVSEENYSQEIAEDTVLLESGIKITYFKHGKGPLLKKGDMVKIDYRLRLEDSTVYDGNHLIKKPYVPFMVGWNQQTPGWDIALKKLRIGDDVDIFLPAKYARGEKGIKGVVPPNSNNILSIRILDYLQPTKEVDDIVIWKYDEWKKPGDSIGFKDEVTIDYWVSSESSPRYDNSYKRGKPFELVMGDGNIVPGLYKALYFARAGDKLFIKIPAKEAYGKKGLTDLVKPNEDLLYDIRIGKVVKREE